ncbi:DUF6531 domain-containing protein [Phytoactinopolyspora halophila]|uniref:DUF6531 domain-containing protein n=1 Tax=Phytoactinopolyspora halophila TaxID=1981511 RepID=UPI00131495A1|nr:DUF6531 domain-containing protein [Phytoactinopolyspora halophila]
MTSTGRLFPLNQFRGNPVNTATGALTESATDAEIASIGQGFSATRSYNSNNESVGVLGKGWTFPYFAHLDIGADGSSVRYIAEDGQEITYEENGDSFEPPEGHATRLESTSDGFALATKEHESIEFDSDGRLSRVEESSGQGVSLAYSGDRLETVTDASDRDFDIDYNADGFISSITLPDGESISYEYDGDLLTSVTDVRGGVTEYEYDSEGRLTSVTNALGHTVTESTYDSAGRVVEQVDAHGGVTEFEYEQDGEYLTTYTTDPLGNVTRDHYYDNVLIEEETAEGAVTTYEYDDRLRLVAETDPHGLVTRHEYDEDDNRIRTEYPNGDVEEFTYSDDGELLSETSPEGHVTEYEYDSSHRVTTMTDPEGGETSYTYTAKGQEKTVTTPEGRTSTYEYDEDGNRIAEISPEGRKTSSEYDALGRVVSETSARGHVDGADPQDFTSTYEYDKAGNLIASSDPAGNVTEFEYDLVDQQVAETDPLGRRTEMEYDAVGNLVRVTDPTGAVTTHEYDAVGNRIATTDAEGATTTWTYDGDGRKISETKPRGNEQGADPAEHTWTYEYDGLGNLISETDPEGRETTYEYDERYRQISVTDPLGQTTTTEYDGDGNAVATTDPLGNTTETVYDGRGLAVEQIDAAGEVTTTEYDGDGLVLAETTPEGHTTTYSYDDDGLMLTRTTPRGNEAEADPDEFTWTHAYDADGNQISVTDPLGGEQTTTYDARGLVTETTDEVGATTTTSYDAAGQVTSVTGPDGAETSYTYTDAGELKTVTDPNGGVTTYGYDQVHRRVSVTDPLDRTRTFSYDADGNQVTEVLARAEEHDDPDRWTITTDVDERGLPTAVTTGSASSSRSFTYDDAGRLVEYADASGTTTQDYDAAGRLVSVSRDHADGGVDEYSYTYDARGLLTEIGYPDGTGVQHEYDADGLRTMTTLPEGFRESYGYDANANLTSTSYLLPEGSKPLRVYRQRQKYDAADRISRVSHSYGNAFMPYISYTRDAAGRPIERARGKEALGVDAAQSYTYDDAGRLDRVCFFEDTEPEQCTTSAGEYIDYDYDGSGNILAEDRHGVDDPGLITYEYDAAHQLVSVDGQEYTHDADGNLTSDGTTTWTYDAFDQIVEAEHEGDVAELAYDAQGNRISVTTGGQQRNLSWDINGELPMLTTVDDPDGQTTYRYGPTGLPTRIHLDDDTQFLFTDALGTVTDAYDGDITPSWHSEYEPFGARRNTTEDGLTTDDLGLGFTGEYHDPATNLLHLRLRDYNPNLGRFTGTDPVTTPTGTPWTSPYAYAGNQPTLLTDPTGSCPWDWCKDLFGSDNFMPTMPFMQDALVGASGAYQTEGFPSRNEIFGGFALGAVSAGESAAHDLASRGRGAHFSEMTGWNGQWLAGQIDDFNSDWYPVTARLGEAGFYAGSIAASLPFGARTTATGLTTRYCPPGLTSNVRSPQQPAPVAPKALPRGGVIIKESDMRHIMENHGPESTVPGKGKFSKGTSESDISAMIDRTVRHGSSRENTKNRPGMIYEYNFGSQIGVDYLGSMSTKLRVVVRPNNTARTAFPYN